MADPPGDRESLVRLARLLIRDDAAAREAVGKVLVAPNLRDAEWQRRAVVSRCRSILRHRAGVR